LSPAGLARGSGDTPGSFFHFTSRIYLFAFSDKPESAQKYAKIFVKKYNYFAFLSQFIWSIFKILEILAFFRREKPALDSPPQIP
jgi:hypothetical protein